MWGGGDKQELLTCCKAAVLESIYEREAEQLGGIFLSLEQNDSVDSGSPL